MIRVEQAHLKTVAISHPGMSGKNNEDKFGVSAFRISEQDSSPVLLAVLSDGIGGHRAGEVASEIAVNTISQHVATSDGLQPVRTLHDAITAASMEIFQQSQAEGRQGMGATCAVVWVSVNRLYTATVGDSRIYLMRQGTIRQLNVDHTWIQEAMEKGLITPEQAEGHPNAHVIRRYLGSPEPPDIDFRLRLSGIGTSPQNEGNQGTLLYPGDRLLLCSDGLTDLVKDEEVLATFETQSMEETIQSLVNLANQRGGHDNITIIAIEIPEGIADKKAVKAKKRLRIGCVLLAVAGGILGGALVAGYLLYNGYLGGRTSATATHLPATLVWQTTEPLKNTVIPAVVTTAVMPAVATSNPTTPVILTKTIQMPMSTSAPTYTSSPGESATSIIATTPSETPTVTGTSTVTPTPTVVKETIPVGAKTP